MPPSAEVITRFFESEFARPVRSRELASLLGIPRKQHREFLEIVEQLVAAGTLHRANNGMLRAARGQHLIPGTLRRTKSGAGVFYPRDPQSIAPDESLFISSLDLLDAFADDDVLVEPLRKRGVGGRPCGRVVEVVQRARRQFVGTYFERGGQGLVTLDGGMITELISVGDPGAKGAKTNDKVVIEMQQFPRAGEVGDGVLVKVLGPRGEPGVDLLSVIHQFDLPDEFPEQVLEEARLVAERFSEDVPAARTDLTAETIITIDPVDARDFDDAISLHQTETGGWRLGVHIADVAWFVLPGSPLDVEAQRRGTSVYLPDKVIPMLPELISNSLASLQQGKVRLTKSVFIEFTADGVPVHTEFHNSAIRVRQRFAYEQVLPILEHPEDHLETVAQDVRELLVRMHDLAAILRRRRFQHGALEMDMPEVKIDLDGEGHVAGAHRTSHDVSHQIIEEFMLAANIAVARELRQRHVPFLQRVHAPPDERKLRLLSDFVKSLGLDIRPMPGRGDLQDLLKSVKGSPYEYAVSYSVLRSMRQAEYSPMNIGHYALAEEDYCHFTSPIRRYPDLTIHRLFNDIASGRAPKGPNESDLLALGEQCSQLERRAEQAERELIKIKLLTYLAAHRGMELDGSITGVESFGIFVTGLALPAEGLVPVTSLRDDYYDFERNAHTLTGRRSGIVFRLGDLVKVRVERVDMAKRTAEFRLVRRLQSSPAPAQRSAASGQVSKGKRGKHDSRPSPRKRRTSR